MRQGPDVGREDEPPSICFPDTAYESQRRGANWIQTYIFPGGLLPSLAVLSGVRLRGTGLLITATQDIREHYVRTFATWRRTFFEHLAEVRPLWIQRSLRADVGLLPVAV